MGGEAPWTLVRSVQRKYSFCWSFLPTKDVFIVGCFTSVRDNDGEMLVMNCCHGVTEFQSPAVHLQHGAVRVTWRKEVSEREKKRSTYIRCGSESGLNVFVFLTFVFSFAWWIWFYWYWWMLMLWTAIRCQLKCRIHDTL